MAKKTKDVDRILAELERAFEKISNQEFRIPTTSLNDETIALLKRHAESSQRVNQGLASIRTGSRQLDELLKALSEAGIVLDEKSLKTHVVSITDATDSSKIVVRRSSSALTSLLQRVFKPGAPVNRPQIVEEPNYYQILRLVDKSMLNEFIRLVSEGFVGTSEELVKRLSHAGYTSGNFNGLPDRAHERVRHVCQFFGVNPDTGILDPDKNEGIEWFIGAVNEEFTPQAVMWYRLFLRFKGQILTVDCFKPRRGTTSQAVTTHDVDEPSARAIQLLDYLVQSKFAVDETLTEPVRQLKWRKNQFAKYADELANLATVLARFCCNEEPEMFPTNGSPIWITMTKQLSQPPFVQNHEFWELLRSYSGGYNLTDLPQRFNPGKPNPTEKVSANGLVVTTETPRGGPVVKVVRKIK